MKRALALMLSVGVLGGCFPHNEKARTYAKYTEGALILAGIGAEVIASRHTGAQCDMQTGAMGYDANCHATSSLYGGVGLAMILAGLTGFIATVSTAEDETEVSPPPLEVKKTEKPDVKLPPGVTPPPAPAEGTPAATPSESAAAPQKPAP
jgi:hypothetical protein